MRASRMASLLVLVPWYAAAASTDAEPAPYGFFDYLGEMVEDDEGEWLDPLAMDTMTDDGESADIDDDGTAVDVPEDEADE